MTRRTNPYEDMQDFFAKVEEDLDALDWSYAGAYGYPERDPIVPGDCCCDKPEPINLSLFRAMFACKKCGRDIKEKDNV